MRRPAPYAWVAFALVAAVGLGGCQSDRPVTPLPPGSSPSGRQAPSASQAGPASTEGTAALLKRRRAAGIADCPASDPRVPARPDGLPEVSLECLGAESTVRLAGLRGTPMVLNVWAQWCGPCRQEAPFLAQAAGKAGDKVRFVGIDYADPRPELAVEFAAQAGWRYPQLVDPDKSVAAGLKVIGPPTTIFVDASGAVTYTHAGPFASATQLEQMIGQYLGVGL